MVRLQRLIHAVVDHLLGQSGFLPRTSRMRSKHDRVVDRITDDREQRGHDGQADFESSTSTKPERARYYLRARNPMVTSTSWINERTAAMPNIAFWNRTQT